MAGCESPILKTRKDEKRFDAFTVALIQIAIDDGNDGLARHRVFEYRSQLQRRQIPVTVVERRHVESERLQNLRAVSEFVSCESFGTEILVAHQALHRITGG